MLAGKGVTAWQRTLTGLAPAARTAPAGPPAPGGRKAALPARLAAELVSVLAAITLAGTRPSPAP